MPKSCLSDRYVDFFAIKDDMGPANVACDGISLPRGGFFLSRAISSASTGRRVRFERKIIMPIGTVKFFNDAKGFGFIAPEDGGEDSFVHISAVERAGMSTLQKEQRVQYEIENDRRGRPSAVNLQSV